MSKLRNTLFLSILVIAAALAGIQSPVHAAAFAPAVSIAAGNGPSSVVTGRFIASDVALNKTVSANYSPAFGSSGLITDNIFAPEGTAWNNAAYAVALSGTLTIDMGQSYSGINRVIIQADNNDTYTIEYSTDGIAWTTLYNVPAVSGAGLRLRDSGLLSPISARYIRLYATGGDGFYSVSELQLFAAATGPLDLAVTNFDADTVSVMIGNGDGTFSRNDIAVGTEPYAIISSDFNSDGIADLAVANSGSDNSVSILLGNGDGTFQAKVDYPVGNTPYALTSGDLDGDGILDIAVANLKSGNISVLIGNGNGAFSVSEPAAFSAGGSPVAIVAADFNADEFNELDELIVKDEIAVATTENSLIIFSLTKNSDNTYTMTKSNKYGVTSNPIAMVKGDFNDDGLPDLAVALSNSKNVSVLIGLGSNLLDFSQDITVDRFPAALVAADINGDGLIDLATSHLSDDNLSVLYGNGNGTFQKPLSFAVGDEPIAVAAGDFNGDGHVDLLTTDYRADTLSLLVNAPSTRINVTSPVGGEHIQAGSGHTITWDAFPGAVSYMIYHSIDNGKTFKKLAKVGSVTSYVWNVSIPKLPNTNDNLIKIVAYNASKKIVAEGSSKSTFAVESASIVFPNGGEVATAGETLSIGWNTFATKKTPTSVKLSYWDGASWRQIVTLSTIPFPPQYDWVLPAFTETRHCYLIKIELKAGNNVVATDITDKFFTVIAP